MIFLLINKSGTEIANIYLLLIEMGLRNVRAVNKLGGYPRFANSLHLFLI